MRSLCSLPRVVAVLLLCALAACVTPKRTATPMFATPEQMRAVVQYEAFTRQLGCSDAAMDEEWKRSRQGPVHPGDAPCVALGRWGAPTTVRTAIIGSRTSVQMEYRQSVLSSVVITYMNEGSGLPWFIGSVLVF